MDFNKIKEMGLEYAEKGRNAAMDLAERGRTQAKIVSEQTKLARAQRQLGALVYSLAKGNEENQPLVDKYIEMIGSIEANLNALKESLGPAAEVITHDLDVVKYVSDRIGVMYLGKMVELADSYELITHSIHPYTRSLISAIPVADPITARQSKRIVLQGDVPSPLNPPSGCRFRTRCPYADEQCANEVPEFKEVSTGHWAACHHLDRVK